MTNRTRQVLALTLGALLWTGCSESKSGDDASAGASGQQVAGSAGISAGAAGQAGSAGAAGQAGSAGANTAGNAGTAGVAADAGAGAGGSAGAAGAAGASQAGNGGASGAAGASQAGNGGAGSGDGGSAGSDPSELEHFSFFITSYAAMVRLSGSEDGFGGDLRHGEADGLTGADKICTEIAEYSMPGAAAKGWRAFLSVAQGPDGERVDAIDRIGEGPWYDRLGRIVAQNLGALANARPQGADPLIVNDLPNEDGVPNHRPDPTQPEVDNHHILTGSDEQGRLSQGSVNGTCDNWTALSNAGRPRVGFSWPAGGRQHWISGQDEGGCGAGYVFGQSGGSDPSNPIVGSGGGYGGFYCFALVP